MNTRFLTKTILENFSQYLVLEEKSTATVEKYLRDVRAFLAFAGQRNVTKELVVSYKSELIEKGYTWSPSL